MIRRSSVRFSILNSIALGSFASVPDPDDESGDDEDEGSGDEDDESGED